MVDDEKVIEEVILEIVALAPFVKPAVALPPAAPFVAAPPAVVLPPTTLVSYPGIPTSYFPPSVDYVAPPRPTPVKRSLVIDIETTSLLPWKGRLFCIGVLDTAKPDDGPIIFVDDNEEKLIRSFIEFYKTGGYTELIGFNVGFDLRWMFAVALRYRISGPELFDTELRDLSQILKQVQERFVYGYNRPGTLEEWAYYLLGMKKLVPYGEEPTDEELRIKKIWDRTELIYKRLNEAYEEKDWETIADFNANDVNMSYGLLSLIELGYGRASSPSTPEEVAEKLPGPGELKERQCPTCGQAYWVAPDQKEVPCDVCEKPFAV